jgi:hypothetical protein
MMYIHKQYKQTDVGVYALACRMRASTDMYAVSSWAYSAWMVALAF